MPGFRWLALSAALMSVTACGEGADAGGAAAEVGADSAVDAPDAGSPADAQADADPPADAGPPDASPDRDDRRPWEEEADPFDQDFDIPRTEPFPPALSAYGLFEGPMAALEPAAGVLRYELASELFTDYAKKQRLVRVPAGAMATADADGRLNFPEGTVLTKTFYYPTDFRAPDGPRRIIETRLLVKTAGVWNAATYLWNAEETDARVLLDGATTEARWLDADGQPQGTEYAVPHEGECVTCHQLDGASTYIGPTVRNLNRLVQRGGASLSQLAHLQAEGALAALDVAAADALPDAWDPALPLAERARAYLDINCAHCHRPGAWDDASSKRLDLRYEVSVAEANLVRKADDMARNLDDGEMPYLGTTLVDEAGVRLVLDYVEGL